ncbi:MAG: hypothetical protein H7321_07380 [Bacteroidia bacterium]|nr:hypothetical protein [Bacteroidia bacterium]
MKLKITTIIIALIICAQSKASGFDSLIISKMKVSFNAGFNDQSLKCGYRGELTYTVNPRFGIGVSYTSINTGNSKYYNVNLSQTEILGSYIYSYDNSKYYQATNAQAIDLNFHFNALNNTSRHIIEPFVGVGYKKFNKVYFIKNSDEKLLYLNIKSHGEIAKSLGFRYAYKVTQRITFGLAATFIDFDGDGAIMFGPELGIKF